MSPDPELVEAVYTLAAIVWQLRTGWAPDQVAQAVAQQRHEIRHALAEWTPPPDSYRALNLENRRPG